MAFDYHTLSAYFKILAHPVRLQILDLLRGGEICVCHIEAALGKRQAYISQQLMILREAGLVETRKDGLQIFYRLSDPLVGRLLESVGDSAVAATEPLPGCRCPRCRVETVQSATEGVGSC